jgi:hypothetical protein
METMSTLERAVLEKLLAGDHSSLAALRQQLEVASVGERTFTGVGFMTTLTVPQEAPRAPVQSHMVRMGDVIAEIDGLKHGAGFLLYIQDGVLDALEGYTYDEPWPDTIRRFTLKYMKEGSRDLCELEK